MSAWPALFWGLFAGSALLIGAVVAWFGNLSRTSVAIIMALGSGILISAVAFDLMEEGFRTAGLQATAVGFVVGALVYTGASYLIQRRDRRGKDAKALQVFAGSIIDGVPESVVIGLSIVAGKGVAIATVIAIFLSNIPEALAATAGLKTAGRSASFVFGLWAVAALLSGIGALAGYAMFDIEDTEARAATQAIAAGALLAMIADNMIPQAFAETHQATGIVAAFGFLAGFALSHGFGG
jgi:ZIP family zinc transporter